MPTWKVIMVDDIQPELQRKIQALERKNKLLEEGLHQAERLREMFDRMAQELKATKLLLIRQSESLEEKVRERTKQLQEAQEELVRKEKLALLGQVADTLGHELRNPLGVMNNAVYFLQTVLADADEITKEYLDIIKDEIAVAERIVSDLLDAVRTKSPYPEMVEVAVLIQKTLRKCYVPPSVTVRLGIPETLPAVLVDPVQMRQVFWNLITNGVEAMPNGGELEITADEDQEAKTVTVSIKDSGSGIAPEHLDRLFQPMFTTKVRRIGLGLVVVKNLTQASGGSVEVESTPGKGSTFSVTLPDGS
jgi:signal transduction histidine kinase